MSDLYKQLMDLGAENCHPVFVGWVDGKKVQLAKVVDGTVYLTQEGKAFVGEEDEVVTDEAPAPKPKAARAKGKPVDPVVVTELEPDTELDLGD